MLYDVIVAGAGPAGSTCAYFCSKAGLNVLLLDREVFPRGKPCGGAVSARALSLLDFPLPPEIIERECFGIRVHYRSLHTEIAADRRIAVLVRRDRFDLHLAEQAVAQGVRFRQGEAAVDVVTGPEIVEVRTARERYRTRYLIGADGVNSVVARSVRPPFRRDEIAAALVCDVPAGDPDAGRNAGGLLDFTFGIAPFGYGWIFPHRGRYSVGIMGRAAEFSGANAGLDGFLRSRAMHAGPVRGHCIPYGGIRRQLASGRILLAGDAAGLADAFQGEGIVHAIHSGMLAARAVGAACRGRADALAAYERECERQIGRNLRIALRMARLLERHPALFCRLFFSHRAALKRYLGIPQGSLDYVRFWRWFLLRLPCLLGGGTPGRSG